VNKVATAIHLRSAIPRFSLPDFYLQGLLRSRNRGISKEGVIVIKAQQYRILEK